jgi:glucose-1-phosphate adenylyltransferase
MQGSLRSWGWPQWHNGGSERFCGAVCDRLNSVRKLAGEGICGTEAKPLRCRTMNKIDMREVMTLVLGGGRGSRLFPLTGMRSKPAVPLAGKYRLIDIPISNAINSGLNRIYVLTQFHSVSLHRHIRQTYRFDPFNGGFVEILAAQQTSDPGTNWYEGTADAVRKNIRYLRQPGINYVLILSGDQLYRMDYRQMVRTHVDRNADVTIAGLPVTQEQARSFGIMRLDSTGRVEGFLEKPQQKEELEHFTVSPTRLRSYGLEATEARCVASMGIYLFNKQTLIDVLEKTTYTDFGKEIFPAAIRSRHVQVHLFDGYWEDIGTIKAFYDANLALASDSPPFQFNDPRAPVYTRARFLPPARIAGATIRQSIIADGCQIGSDVVIENSIVGVGSIVGSGCVIRNSVLMGNDDPDEIGDVEAVGIGRNTRIEGAIVDKNCRIGSGVTIHCAPDADDRDFEVGCYIRDGIPVIIKDGVIPAGWTLR